MGKKDIKKKLRDFIHGKPHGERRLGELYQPKPAFTSTASGAG